MPKSSRPPRFHFSENLIDPNKQPKSLLSNILKRSFTSSLLGSEVLMSRPTLWLASLPLDPRDILLRVQTRPRTVDFYGW
jgi:hypothetical protein